MSCYVLCTWAPTECPSQQKKLTRACTELQAGSPVKAKQRVIVGNSSCASLTSSYEGGPPLFDLHSCRPS